MRWRIKEMKIRVDGLCTAMRHPLGDYILLCFSRQSERRARCRARATLDDHPPTRFGGHGLLQVL